LESGRIMDKLQPVAWIIESDEEFKNGKNYPTLDWYVKDILNLPIGTKLYTHPVKDLEDIDINITWNENSMRDFGKDELNFARAILKKAQEK